MEIFIWCSVRKWTYILNYIIYRFTIYELNWNGRAIKMYNQTWEFLHVLYIYTKYKASFPVKVRLVPKNVKGCRKSIWMKDCKRKGKGIRNASGYQEDFRCGDKSFSIFLGRSFQVLVSEPSLFRLEVDEGSWKGSQVRLQEAKMRFFARNKTLQDAGDVSVILLD